MRPAAPTRAGRSIDRADPPAMATTVAAPLPDRWTEDARWLAQAVDPLSRLIRLVQMDEAAYRSASFLDDRILRPELETRLCSLDQAMADAGSLERDDARWIFHLGHVGSTLISRLLGEIEGVLSIREPRSLRDLIVAREERPALARNLCRLFSRGFTQDQVGLVKTTSFVSEHAAILVPPGGAALFLYATPENYIAGMLAGENSTRQLAARHQGRCSRLRRRAIDLENFEATNAHRAAAAWACEATSLEAASDALADRRVLWADFDVMLIDMAEWLGRCAAHFEFTVSQPRLDELANGPLMNRYSKALEYDYSPAFRADRLAEATRQNLSHMEAAIADLKEAARSAPLLKRALERAEQES